MDTASGNLDSAARESLLASLRELPARDFASHQLLDRVPWLFSDRSQYIDWKAALAADLGIDPYMLLVVGSAAIGFSLSPWKEFAAFHPLSDVDVAVVSTRHFDDAWRYIRDLGPEKLLSKFDRDMFTRHRKSLVFDGAIATERFLSRLSFGPKWASGLGHAGKREPTIGRSVKARIYRDFESLRKYHETNINELKLRLSSAEVDSASETFPRLGGAEEAMAAKVGDEVL